MQLNRSIAFTASWWRTLVIALVLGAIISFIMVFLQPFDTRQDRTVNENLLLAGYGLCIVIPILLLHIPELQWYRKQQSRWFLANEIVMLFLGFLFIGSLSYLYNTVVINKLALNLEYAWAWLLQFGLPFVPIVIPLWAFLRYQMSSVTIQREDPGRNLIEVSGENTGETLKFGPNQFICARSQSNYVDLWLLGENETAEKHVLRSTLSGLVEQIPHARQVHRSYLLNPEHIEALHGNTRKGSATLKHYIEKVPVSPKHFKALKTYLQHRP